jgi:hypothetical protein
MVWGEEGPIRLQNLMEAGDWMEATSAGWGSPIYGNEHAVTLSDQKKGARLPWLPPFPPRPPKCAHTGLHCVRNAPLPCAFHMVQARGPLLHRVSRAGEAVQPSNQAPLQLAGLAQRLCSLTNAPIMCNSFSGFLLPTVSSHTSCFCPVIFFMYRQNAY